MQVELGVDVFVSSTLELGIKDTVDDPDVLCGLTEVLATHDELAIYIAEERIERDRRIDPSFLIRFYALRRENAFVDDDFATSGGDRHRANFISDVNMWNA